MKIIINIDVPALAPAIDFYTRALGLRHTRTLDDDVAELTGASATLYLLQKGEGTAAVKAPPIARGYQRHWTPVHLDFVVEDIHAAVAKVRELGGTAEEPTESPSGWSAECRDDQGTLFCLSVLSAAYSG